MDIKIKFNNKKDAAFVAELKDRVNSYFEDNHISTYANFPMVLKTVAMLSMYFGSYFFIISGWFNEIQMISFCVLMGLGAVGIGCAVQHDANHSAYSEKEWINKMLGFTLTLIGGNDYMWRIKHNVFHHTYTNIYGKDEDISVVKILRLSPNAPLNAFHRLQHYFAWFAYGTLTFFWVFYFDFPKLTRYNGNGSPNPEVKHPVSEVVILFVSKIFYILYALVIPYLLLGLPFWKIFVGFTIMHFVAGFLLTTVFQLAHIVEETEHPHYDENGNIDTAWFVHQIETTSNFATKNKFVTWFVGGLNFQVEHHLFPRICSIHYPKINQIVKETTEKYQIPYHEQKTLGNALTSHYQMLKKFSR
jgi:linoleoyl-CoA desaturase